MALAPIFTAKFGEQVERTHALIARVPPGRWSWQPLLPAGAASLPPLPLAGILQHLQQSLAGLAATLYALDPSRFAALSALRPLGDAPPPAAAEAWQARLAAYWDAIAPALRSLSDADLAINVPTVFRPAGEPAATLLLGNLEHFINHKYQLYFYLKLMGLAVATPDLYQLR